MQREKKNGKEKNGNQRKESYVLRRMDERLGNRPAVREAVTEQQRGLGKSCFLPLSKDETIMLQMLPQKYFSTINMVIYLC